MNPKVHSTSTFRIHTGGMTTAILMLINTPMSKALTFMTSTTIMITISITTRNNTRVMRNTPVTTMKEELNHLLNLMMKTR